MKKKMTLKDKMEKDFDLLAKATKKDLKVKVTTWIDSDVYEKLHELASDRVTKYQTLLNQILREGTFKESPLKEIEKRLSLIEKKLAV